MTLFVLSSFFLLNVSRRAAKFIDKKEDDHETCTAQFAGKPSETLNNGKATPTSERILLEFVLSFPIG
jgi:hypothetical protein